MQMVDEKPSIERQPQRPNIPKSHTPATDASSHNSRPPAEEKKRGGWGVQKAQPGKGPRTNSKNDDAGPKSKNNAMRGGGGMGQKKQSAAGLGRYDSENADDMQNITSPDNKRKKQEDWNYLK